MLDRKKILENPTFIKEKLALKGYDFNVEVFLDLEEKRKNLQTKIEDLRAARNANANEIKNAFKQKIEKEKIELLKTNGKELNETITEEQKGLVLIQEKLEEIYLEMPSIPDEDCPIGENEEDNKLVRTHLEPKVFDFEVKDHIDLAEINENGLDFEKGVKLARSRFTVMKGGIATFKSFSPLKYIIKKISSGPKSVANLIMGLFITKC